MSQEVAWMTRRRPESKWAGEFLSVIRIHFKMLNSPMWSRENFIPKLVVVFSFPDHSYLVCNLGNFLKVESHFRHLQLYFLVEKKGMWRETKAGEKRDEVIIWLSWCLWFCLWQVSLVLIFFPFKKRFVVLERVT